MVLLSPSEALGQTPARVCDPEDPQACSQPLEKGQAAPYAGQLLTPRLAVRLGQRAERCDQQLELERGYMQKLVLIERELAGERVRIEQDARTREREYLLGELAKKDSVPWYQRPVFVMAVTFVLTTGLISAVYFGMD